MTLTRIPADEHRRVDIPGTPGPVRRPVDIDQGQTGFRKLRTLRIYRFDLGSDIEGHAEEDEVYLVVLGGAVELTITPAGDDAASMGPRTLQAPTTPGEPSNAAYMPPGSAYRLVCSAGAEVGYARATPSGSRPPQIFRVRGEVTRPGVSTLLDPGKHAERLRLRVLRISVGSTPLTLDPVFAAGPGAETLLYLRTTHPASAVHVVGDATAAPLALNSWDTLVIPPGDHPELHFPEAWEGVALVVAAS